ncbi:MAG: hypothetical protein FWE08_03770 [Oscillospiraceae bacterium]|nr:hypothetical protein [Oscillospiraceae bacterium]
MFDTVEIIKSSEIRQNPNFQRPCTVIATAHAKIYMPLEELVDLQSEHERLTKELVKAQEGLER